MLHRSAVEWPCLSLDVLVRDRCSAQGAVNPKDWFQYQNSFGKQREDKYPMSVYFCAGSQSVNKNENKIYVMKWANMRRTLDEDKDDDSSSDESDGDIDGKEAIIKFESVPHRGCVNRIRTMYSSSIVATWSDEGEVGIYNIGAAVEELDNPATEPQPTTTASKKKKKKKAAKKNFGGSLLAKFKHKQEGYALEWSPNTYGRLASGGCDSSLWVYTPADENCSTFLKESQVGLQSHKASIEDIQWSPS